MKNRTQLLSLDLDQIHQMSSVVCHKVVCLVLFIFSYTAVVTAIAYRHSVGAHSYADDTQLHVHRKADDLESSIPHLVTYINEINCWISTDRVNLNTDKTQFILLGIRQQLVKVVRKSISLDGWIYRSQTMSLTWAWCATTN